MAPSEKDIEVQPDGNDSSSINAGEMSDDDRAMQQRVLSKFDKWVMPQMALLVLFGYLDRTNIGECQIDALQ